MKNNRYSLRALSALMGYPDAQLRSHLPELLQAIDKEAVIPAARRQAQELEEEADHSAFQLRVMANALEGATPPQPQAPAAPDNSYLGSLMDSLSSIVSIRAIGETDWPGVAGQALSFAESGDLNQAIAVIDAAEGDKPMALVQWRDRAAARLQLEAALAEVSDAVLRQIAALGGGQQ
jgi:hypothetical protein